MTKQNPSARARNPRAWFTRRRMLSLLPVFTLVFLAVGAAELIARHVIQARVAHAQPSLGKDVTVSESGSALWDVSTGHIQSLDIGSDDATIGPLPQISIQAQLDDVRLGGQATVASTHAQITVPTQSIAAAIEADDPSVTVSSVTTDPAAGTIIVSVGPGGLGQLTLRPVLTSGKVSITAVGLSFLGQSMPLSSLGHAGAGLTTARATQHAYPLGLKATTLTVQPSGLDVTLSGGHSKLTAS